MAWSIDKYKVAGPSNKPDPYIPGPETPPVWEPRDMTITIGTRDFRKQQNARRTSDRENKGHGFNVVEGG